MMQHSIGTFSHTSPAMVHHKKDHVTQDIVGTYAAFSTVLVPFLDNPVLKVNKCGK